MKHVRLLLFACLAGCAATRTTAPGDGRVAVDSYVLLGQVALERQQPEEATGHYVNAALVSDDPAVAERATRMAHRLGLTDLGLAAVERWRRDCARRRAQLLVFRDLRNALEKAGPGDRRLHYTDRPA